MAIRDTVARLISDVYEGKLHPADRCRFGTSQALTVSSGPRGEGSSGAETAKAKCLGTFREFVHGIRIGLGYGASRNWG
jgi:hypothetical protein